MSHDFYADKMAKDSEKNKFDENIEYYYKEIPLAADLMDGLFTQEDGLFFEFYDYHKRIDSDTKENLIKIISNSLTSGKLTSQQEKTLKLIFFEGLREDIIAKKMGVHQTTVSQHKRYGIRKLKKIILMNISNGLIEETLKNDLKKPTSISLSQKRRLAKRKRS